MSFYVGQPIQITFPEYIDIKQKGLDQMPECPHKQEINRFCYQNNCPNQVVGGCSKCFELSASGVHTHQILSLEQLERLQRKFIFPKRVKPECPSLQEAYYHYFQKLKQQLKELPNAVDEICKSVVNKIGFPFIYSNNHFNTFKRIKNKEYSRINPLQFHTFIKETKDISTQKLTEQEQRIYLEQVESFHVMVAQLDRAMSIFETVIENYANVFKFKQHREASFNIEAVMTKIASVSSKIGTGKEHSLHDEARTTEQSHKESANYSGERRKIDRPKPPALALNRTHTVNSVKKQEVKRDDKVNLLNPNTLKESSSPGRRARRNSIDNHIVKANRLGEKAESLRRRHNLGEKEQRDERDEQIISSSEEIKNHDLPEIQNDPKLNKNNEKYGVKPVTRKLEENYINYQEDEELASPLLKHKLKKNSQRNSPFMLDSPEKKFKSFLNPQPVQNSLPPLSDNEEKSLVLLTASIKLDTKEAIPLLELALTECQTNLSAAEYLSYLYLIDKKPKKCLVLCEQFLESLTGNTELQSSYILLLSNKGAALNQLGRYSEAVKLLEGQDSQNEAILKNLANSYFALGFYQKAIPLYRRALQDNNDDEMSYNLSACLYMQKNYQEAKMIIRNAINSQPKKPEYVELQTQILRKLAKKQT